MEQTKKVGLVLGKFAPLHKGHQYLIEVAKKQVDRLYILVYEAREVTDIPLITRANWIRRIYPDVMVIEGNNSPTDDNRTKRVMKLQDDYIVSMMPEKITHFFSSEWYGEHVSKALGAINVEVDRDRLTVPISATRIRKNLFETRQYIDPIVNRDMIKKIIFLGAESSGKTTISEELAKIYQTSVVPEFGREYWIRNHDSDGKLTSEQLLELAEEHRKSEEKIFPESNRIVFCDTGASTTKHFCEFYGNSVPAELNAMVNEEKNRYDMFVICSSDIPFVQDGTRNPKEIQESAETKIINDLRKRHIHFIILSGSLNNRIQVMKSMIRRNFDILP